MADHDGNGEDQLDRGDPAASGAVRRLVVVSNRLPVVLQRDERGQYHVTPGAGGLVTALAPVLGNRGGLWIGWPGVVGDDGAEALIRAGLDQVGYALEPVTLTQRELERYYHGFANEVLWPLFHDLPDRCNFDPDHWPVYQQVNAKFAEAVARTTTGQDYIWVHDYHLLLLADALRQRGIPRRVGFFLHIPFPPLEGFMKLPWRFQVLQSMLQFDLLGFQTARDLRNFIQCVRTLLPAARVSAGRKMAASISTPERTLRLGAFPIGIDSKKFARVAASEDVANEAWYIHEELPERKLVLGVDRLDYTKGIPQRIRALGDLLQRYPEHRRNLTFIQVVVPSRTEVREYQFLKREIERLVGRVNGRFTEKGWTPIHYIYRPLDYTQLLAYYRTCEINLVTPLKDGMNLVCKEYCACSVEDGALILSEFAGAAAQMQTGALLVNPFDIQGIADALHEALTMSHEERLARMRRLRRVVRRQNVFWWVDSFLKAAIARDLSAFPEVDYYVPRAPPREKRQQASLTSSGL